MLNNSPYLIDWFWLDATFSTVSADRVHFVLLEENLGIHAQNLHSLCNPAVQIRFLFVPSHNTCDVFGWLWIFLVCWLRVTFSRILLVTCRCVRVIHSSDPTKGKTEHSLRAAFKIAATTTVPFPVTEVFSSFISFQFLRLPLKSF